MRATIYSPRRRARPALTSPPRDPESAANDFPRERHRSPRFSGIARISRNYFLTSTLDALPRDEFMMKIVIIKR